MGVIQRIEIFYKINNGEKTATSLTTAQVLWLWKRNKGKTNYNDSNKAKHAEH